MIDQLRIELDDTERRLAEAETKREQAMAALAQTNALRYKSPKRDRRTLDLMLKVDSLTNDVNTLKVRRSAIRARLEQELKAEQAKLDEARQRLEADGADDA